MISGTHGRPRQLRVRFIHGNQSIGLQAALALQHFDNDTRSLIGDLKSTAPQTRDVQENIGHPIVRNDESITLIRIEPFDDTRYLDKIHNRIGIARTVAANCSKFASQLTRRNSI
jgi:hypothetical protein